MKQKEKKTWEQRKLKEFTRSYSGGTPSASNSNYYGGNIPFIRSAEINSSSTELFLTKQGLENSSAKLVQKGDILYALYGATSGQVGISKINGAINQAVLAIIPTEDDAPDFIKQWLSMKKKRIISRYLQGGQGNLSGKIVTDLSMQKPKVNKEEFAVGTLLKKADSLIAANEYNHKNALNIRARFYPCIFT
ncbi:restriction endonuclease subunit S [Lactiplantibacillus pentosus]|uniref:restriction endonuclease subunit S n=1 Tax=Lactiplantibacillus pentosus TaxID=1589 RepID=UPI00345BC35E